jgi:hypothetical protein
MTERDKFANKGEFRPDGPSVRFRDPVKEGIDKHDEVIRSRKSIGEFVAFGGEKTGVKLQETHKAPQLGKPFEVAPTPTLTVMPLTPPTCNLRDAKQIQILGGPDQVTPRQKLEDIQKRLSKHTAPKFPPERYSEPALTPTPDEFRLGVSVERLVFLERVEKIMASEARIKEIEAENKTLIGMVGRLQKEIEELKAKLGQKL